MDTDGSALLVQFALAWVLPCGIIGALIGPRKGRAPLRGFAIGGIGGPFGLVYLALQRDVARSGRLMPPSPTDELLKLGEARRQGLVTQEEFEAKKRELLARM